MNINNSIQQHIEVFQQFNLVWYNVMFTFCYLIHLYIFIYVVLCSVINYFFVQFRFRIILYIYFCGRRGIWNQLGIRRWSTSSTRMQECLRYLYILVKMEEVVIAKYILILIYPFQLIIYISFSRYCICFISKGSAGGWTVYLLLSTPLLHDFRDIASQFDWILCSCGFNGWDLSSDPTHGFYSLDSPGLRSLLISEFLKTSK